MRQVTSLFSDDIRHEIGGKVSYIGVYNSALMMPSFPANLSKLCVTVKLLNPPSEPFKEAIFRVLKDEEILAEGVITGEETHKFSQAAGTDDGIDPENRLMAIQSIFVFSPLVVEGPCILRVRVIVDGAELKGSGLRISAAPDGTVFPAI